MGEDKRKVTTVEEEAAAKSPRKSPRLAPAVLPPAAAPRESSESPSTPRESSESPSTPPESSASPSTPPESSESPSMPLDSSELTAAGECEAATTSGSSDGSLQHEHMFMTDEELGTIANKFKTAKEHPMCQHDECKVTWKGASDGGGEDAGMMLCTECRSHFCTGPVGDRQNPRGHAYWHGNNARHRVALWYDDPYQAYCFDCEQGLTLGGNSQNKDEWAVVARNGKDQWGSDDVGGHASGIALGDGYVIRGMPNLGKSCYMNAVLQCLLALRKLRRMILGVVWYDARNFSTGWYLKQLFIETSSENDARSLLDPHMLFDCEFAQQFKPNDMEDAYQFFVNLRNALDQDIKFLNVTNGLLLLCNILDLGPGSLPAVGESIFGVQLCQTISCKSCPNNSVTHVELSDLQTPVALPSKDPLTRSVVSPPRIESHTSPRNICKKLFQETDKSDGEKLQTIADGGELGDGAMEKKPEPLQVDSTEVKDVVHGIMPPFVITEDKGKSQSSDIIPPLVITEDKGKAQCSGIIHDVAEHMNSLSTIEDCLALLLMEQQVKWTCGNCSAELRRTNSSKISEQMMGSTNVNTTDGGDQTEQADRKTSPSEQSIDLNRFSLECTSPSRQPHGSDAQHQVILSVDRTTKEITSETSCDEKDSPSSSKGMKKPESHEVVQEAVPKCLPTDKQTNLLSVQDSQVTRTQGSGKQVRLDDHSAKQVDEDTIEQKDGNSGATQTILLTKLPPVLTIHLKRFATDLSKLVGHVSFKEILHVGPFVDPSCEDKDNSSYRLVGVIEHLGPNLGGGHYIAYVRADQQRSGSSSWVCADDSNIRDVSLQEVLRCEAYILFYERMEEDE